MSLLEKQEFKQEKSKEKNILAITTFAIIFTQ
jgi:hypothetical protein